MAFWRDDVVQALRLVGGVGHLSEIYAAVRKVRPGPWPKTTNAIVRRELENNSSDTDNFKHRHDLFYSVEGVGKGVWGLREMEEMSPESCDLDEPTRAASTVYRILRDTRLARALKQLHKNECQICGETIVLKDGTRYSEAHHIQPLGKPHNGPDVSSNILVLCPNHHVLCDYAAVTLDLRELRIRQGHDVGSQFVSYHNRLFEARSAR